MLPLDVITLYRRTTFRLDAPERLNSLDEAAAYVRQRGYVFFWPISGIPLPSIWVAAAGDRPVPDEHDDPGHVTWGWKDQALSGSYWYYAKVLRKKSTMISLELLPYFYALSENYGAPDQDYLTLYEQGRMTVEAKLIYETLLQRGRMNTIELRKACRASSGSGFDKALTDLQVDFKIVPVGISDAGSWHYSFIYDTVHVRYPDLPEQARPIGEAEARRFLAEAYFRSLGGASLRDLVKLFGWRLPAAQAAVETLTAAGLVQPGVAVAGQKDPWIVLRSIVIE